MEPNDDIKSHPKHSKPIVVAPCHPSLPVYAKGLCKACYMRELRNMPASRVRNQNHKWWSFGVKYMTVTGLKQMTVDHFHTMIATQNGICKCCGKPNVNDKQGNPRELRLNWNLDTGMVRGLVCDRCHAILNHKLNSLTFPDNPNHIRALGKFHLDQVDYYNRIADFAETVETAPEDRF